MAHNPAAGGGAPGGGASGGGPDYKKFGLVKNLESHSGMNVSRQT